MNTTTPQTQARCHILELPAELRTMIWELVLTINTGSSDDRIRLFHQEDADIKRIKVDFPGPKLTPPAYQLRNRIAARRPALRPKVPDTRPNPVQLLGPSLLALLRTCHQIYAEATGIFYANNHIQTTALDFQRMHALTPSRLSCITRMYVQTDSVMGDEEEQQAFLACKLAVSLPRLVDLTIGASYRMLEPSERSGRVRRAIGRLYQVEKLVVRIAPYRPRCRGQCLRRWEQIRRALEGALPREAARRQGKVVVEEIMIESR
ncbi:hypothetical protein CLAFUW4_13494 [Fulvia fulva]|uniref:DUF7730 domain-containing protein n=1 Tax=Passalora fulva TaxID=5499 RepID=A0A9Q8UV01_PASFU|nr:uncharacterized protein CLAFUR5_13346 [Fulvia fulva]KAK4611618.1 hypothetical protein CLAFUR4_13497 [Fulvia fulva]KAK4612697.1 hypothetical protein CLAFUR0_13505 [Fulvia fulva]UJO23438.1 hypothetical protein CLAFUR5_13346 [Fulvia fulva]WPV21124.1 hypothetical protein CLAFUW4_13494 [Fulvia fulva]WPV36053.1 hypothetical protein CLAFUW7_13501 [Fulvia fulva]